MEKVIVTYENIYEVREKIRKLLCNNYFSVHYGNYKFGENKVSSFNQTSELLEMGKNTHHSYLVDIKRNYNNCIDIDYYASNYCCPLTHSIFVRNIIIFTKNNIITINENPPSYNNINWAVKFIINKKLNKIREIKKIDKIKKLDGEFHFGTHFLNDNYFTITLKYSDQINVEKVFDIAWDAGIRNNPGIFSYITNRFDDKYKDNKLKLNSLFVDFNISSNSVVSFEMKFGVDIKDRDADSIKMECMDKCCDSIISFVEAIWPILKGIDIDDASINMDRLDWGMDIKIAGIDHAI